MNDRIRAETLITANPVCISTIKSVKPSHKKCPSNTGYFLWEGLHHSITQPRQH